MLMFPNQLLIRFLLALVQNFVRKHGRKLQGTQPLIQDKELIHFLATQVKMPSQPAVSILAPTRILALISQIGGTWVSQVAVKDTVTLAMRMLERSAPDLNSLRIRLRSEVLFQMVLGHRHWRSNTFH